MNKALSNTDKYELRELNSARVQNVANYEKTKKSVQHLGWFEYGMRILAIFICASGCACCIYSLILQIQEMIGFTATICWFLGLAGMVASASAYVVTCYPQTKNYARQAIIVVVALVFINFYFMFFFWGVQFTIWLVCIEFVVQSILLIAYHFVLKHRVKVTVSTTDTNQE